MCAFPKRSELYRGLFNDCLLTVCFSPFVSYVYDVVVKSLRSLSHLLMSFLLLLTNVFFSVSTADINCEYDMLTTVPGIRI